jgi:hypothetical protein
LTDSGPADTSGPDGAPSDTAPGETSPGTEDVRGSDTALPDTVPTADTTAPDGTPGDTSPGPVDAADAADSGLSDASEVDGDDLTLPAVRPPIVATHSTFAGDWTMQPGREVTKCVVKRLDNADPIFVSQIRTKLNAGSHHLIVYKSAETVEQPTPFNCEPFVETLKGETYPLMITQIREETLQFPNGIAFRFEPNQMIRLEAHYLNYYPDPIVAHADVFFDAIAEADVVAEADLLFYGNPDLRIPPNTSYESPLRHLSVLPGTRVFAMTGHTHQYGTNVEVAMTSSLEDPGMSVYPPEGEGFTWDEPPVTYYDPPLVFGEGQGFNYKCAWNNTSSGTLTFGESANNEMCFFWAYYYPSQGYRLCLSPGAIGDGVAGDEVCCPGHWVCDYVRQFL